jgi:dGTPase
LGSEEKEGAGLAVRRHAEASAKPEDPRSPFQVDHDRIMYSSAFRRLAQVGQVVSSSEGHVFHNRLTHSLKVAQIARRLAERLRDESSGASRLPDPDLAEAAALAHDLGHPPFGHIAEETLDRLVIAKGNEDGFEGNAQTFRILVRLAVHDERYHGLDLSRGCLRGALKYPWLRGDGPAEKPKKFGAFREDEDDFRFAVKGSEPQHPSLEAQIMDLADGLTYSVHDFFDFYQAGFIPLDEIKADPAPHLDSFKRSGKVQPDAVDEHAQSIEELFELLPPIGFSGDRAARIEVRERSSALIDRALAQISLASNGETDRLVHEPATDIKLRFLQHLVWKFVIRGRRVGSQQLGQTRIIERLFRVFYRSAMETLKPELDLIPQAFEDQLDGVRTEAEDRRRPRAARLAADVVSSLTEDQARTLHGRYCGTGLGSVQDRIEA